MIGRLAKEGSPLPKSLIEVHQGPGRACERQSVRTAGCGGIRADVGGNLEGIC